MIMIRLKEINSMIMIRFQREKCDDYNEDDHRRRTFGGATGAILDVDFSIGTDVSVTIPVPQVS